MNLVFDSLGIGYNSQKPNILLESLLLPIAPNLIMEDIKPNQIIGDTITLDDAAPTGQARFLSPKAPNIIRAFRVHITGQVKSGGQDLTIIAHEVLFDDHGAIDASGKPGEDQPQLRLDYPKDPKDITGGAPGGDNGKKGGDVAIYADIVSGIIRVNSIGGSGGMGRPGANGPLITSKPPQPPDVKGGQYRKNYCPPPAGTKGFSGHQGQTAGPPGVSAPGGQLDVWLSKVTVPGPTIIARLDGGSAPPETTAGTTSAGGDGGDGGFCKWSEVHDSGREGVGHTVSGKSAQGSPGPKGDTPPGAAPQTQKPNKGAPGKLNGDSVERNAACHPLSVEKFASQCSVPQMASILKAAEAFYLNDNSGEAEPRLRWVRALAPLIPSNSEVAHSA